MKTEKTTQKKQVHKRIFLAFFEFISTAGTQPFDASTVVFAIVSIGRVNHH